MKPLLDKGFKEFCCRKGCCFLLYKDLSEEYRARKVLCCKFMSNHNLKISKTTKKISLEHLAHFIKTFKFQVRVLFYRIKQ